MLTSKKKFVGDMYDLPNDTLMDQIFANNKSISPTAHEAMNGSLDHYSYYIVGVHMFTRPGITWESQHPWDRMLGRMYRMFQADVQINAPKERTLFNYKYFLSLTSSAYGHCSV